MKNTSRRNPLAITMALFLALVLPASCGYPFQDPSSPLMAAPSGLAYPGLPASLTVGTALAKVEPSFQGRATIFSIKPSLPAGLSFDTATGSISGTPSTTIGPANYRVTAAGPAGLTGAVLRFSVDDPVVVTPPPALSIYVVGYWNDASKRNAAYWTGASRTDLAGDGINDFSAVSLAVDAGSVYAGGSFWNGSSYAPCFWKDGARTDLQGVSGRDAEVLGIAVDAGHVFSGGYYLDSKGYENACFWADTALVPLAIDKTRAKTSDVWNLTATGGHVYSVGSWIDWGAPWTVKPDVPCFWTDTTRTDLPIGAGAYDAEADGIFVADGTVYCAGYWRDAVSPKLYIPCYWVGSSRVDLGDGSHDSEAASIFVAGGHVYLAGYYNDWSKNVPCYWVDGTRYDLAGDGAHNAYASGISVSGSTLYCSGYWYDGIKWTACYWQDGVRTDLADDGTHDSRAKMVVIK